MNVYYYRLLLSSGRIKAGIAQLSVEHDSSARMWLEEHGATVILLKRLPGWLAETQRSLAHLLRPNIRPPELAGMLRDMAVMTSSGIPVLEALRAVAQEVGTGRASNAARVARNLLDELDAGAGLSEAFNRYPDTFPETVRNLVMIGDETGSMDRMLTGSRRPRRTRRPHDRRHPAGIDLPGVRVQRDLRRRRLLDLLRHPQPHLAVQADERQAAAADGGGDRVLRVVHRARGRHPDQHGRACLRAVGDLAATAARSGAACITCCTGCRSPRPS